MLNALQPITFTDPIYRRGRFTAPDPANSKDPLRTMQPAPDQHAPLFSWTPLAVDLLRTSIVWASKVWQPTQGFYF